MILNTFLASNNFNSLKLCVKNKNCFAALGRACGVSRPVISCL
jgi:hypothetical protein